MNHINIRELILKKFDSQLKTSQSLEKMLGAQNANLDSHIKMVCTALENNWKIEDYFPIEEKRKIFDSGLVSDSLKMLWFASIATDDVTLYQFTVSGLSWKKGRHAELMPAIDSQSEYLKHHKPKNIMEWIFENRKEERQLFNNLGTALLYCVENESKKQKNMLLQSPLSTNREDVYSFLTHTTDSNLFNRVIKKHQKTFGFSTNNIILNRSELNNDINIIEQIYLNCSPEQRREKIDFLREKNLLNTAAYFTHQHFLETLPPKPDKVPRIKI